MSINDRGENWRWIRGFFHTTSEKKKSTGAKIPVDPSELTIYTHIKYNYINIIVKYLLKFILLF